MKTDAKEHDSLEEIDPDICPICGNENNCMRLQQEGHELCWCAFESFPPEIFDLVPEEKLNKACICKPCLDEFIKTGCLKY